MRLLRSVLPISIAAATLLVSATVTATSTAASNAPEQPMASAPAPTPMPPARPSIEGGTSSCPGPLEKHPLARNWRQVASDGKRKSLCLAATPSHVGASIMQRSRRMFSAALLRHTTYSSMVAPSWCAQSNTQPLWRRTWHLTEYCFNWVQTVYMYETGNPDPIGSQDFLIQNYSYWSVTSDGWTDEQFIAASANSGALVGVPFSAVAESDSALSTCSQLNHDATLGSCSRLSANWPADKYTVYPPPGANDLVLSANASYLSNVPKTREARYISSLSPRLMYTGTRKVVNPVFNLPETVVYGGTGTRTDVNGPWVFCDFDYPGPQYAEPSVDYPGCRAPSNLFTPTITYRISGNYPAVATHIQQSQAAGVPGSPSSGSYLLRTADQTLTNKNGNIACPAAWDRPEPPAVPVTYSCDEYPFRSTYDGASENPNSGITFSQCWIDQLPQDTPSPKWSSCMVPAGQNSGAGSQVGAFYKRNRVGDNSRFYVKIIP